MVSVSFGHEENGSSPRKQQKDVPLPEHVLLQIRYIIKLIWNSVLYGQSQILQRGPVDGKRKIQGF